MKQHLIFRFPVIIGFLSVLTGSAVGQTLYVPSGATGIGTSNTVNVGIGVSSPLYKVQIAAAANQQIATYISTASAATDFGTGGTGWQFSRPEDGSFAHAIYSYNSPGAAKNNLAMSSRDDIVFTAGNGGPNSAPERMRIVDNGRVGIGTSTPATVLQVLGPITSGTGDSTAGIDYLYGSYGNGKLFTVGSLYSSAASFLGFGVKAKPGAMGYASSTGITVGRSAYEANNGYLAFWTGAAQASSDGGVAVVAERMRIDSSGNVGIGTTTPTQKLSVNGTIQAKEVIVQTGWSDYVFDKDYPLLPLSAVEQSIKKEGHLPGVPSAREVADHGVSLGSVESILLEKIEEITLHQITQEKKMEALEAKNSRLETQVAELKTTQN